MMLGRLTVKLERTNGESEAEDGRREEGRKGRSAFELKESPLPKGKRAEKGENTY